MRIAYTKVRLKTQIIFIKVSRYDECINTIFLTDNISVHYNKLTNEVTCDGVKIIDVKNGPISLPILNNVVLKLQEKSFTKFNYLKCKVSLQYIYTFNYI